jgi:hypothetical protein
MKVCAFRCLARQAGGSGALLRELYGDESFIAPDHFAISLYSAVLEKTQGKMMRQVRQQMLDPEARSNFRNVPD